MRRTGSVAEHLAQRVLSEGDCLVWTGARKPTGHGNISINGKMLQVHRVAYALAHGPIPDGLVVRHRCDNPPCIRVEHLELGTHRDNTQDIIARGRPSGRKRRVIPFGEELIPQAYSVTRQQREWLRKHGGSQGASALLRSLVQAAMDAEQQPERISA